MAALKEARALLSAFVGQLGRDRQRVGVVALVALLLLALMPLLFARVTTAGITADISSVGEMFGVKGGSSGIGAIAQFASIIESLGRSAEAFDALREGRSLPAGFNLSDLKIPTPPYRLNYAFRLYLVAAVLSIITALLAIVLMYALVVRCISKPVEIRLTRGSLSDIDLLLSLEKSSSK